MDMPRPSEAHRRLAALVGVWTGEEQLQPSPWDPVGGLAEGRAENRLALDGFAVVHDYEQRRGGQTSFRGHGVFRYDVEEGCYMLHWFDSMGTSPGLFRGTFEGDVLQLQSDMGQGHVRASWDFSQPDAYQYRMDVSGDGQNWQLFTEGRYRKV